MLLFACWLLVCLFVCLSLFVFVCFHLLAFSFSGFSVIIASFVIFFVADMFLPPHFDSRLRAQERERYFLVVLVPTQHVRCSWITTQSLERFPFFWLFLFFDLLFCFTSSCCVCQAFSSFFAPPLKSSLECHILYTITF